MKKILTIVGLAGFVLASCSNSENEFPDFEYQTVYFAQPTIGRTIELGDAMDVDLTLDNEHKFCVKAVRGGAYKNKANRIIHFKVDEAMCENVYFTEDWGSKKVQVLPKEYYTFESEDIVIPAGHIDGGVVVKLTDAFFNDPQALDFNYVLPLVMTGTEGTDSILQGKKLVENPNRLDPTHWSVPAKDYVLYCLRFVNEWNGNYMRRGKDVITPADGTPVEIIRHKDYIERDEVVTASTTGYRNCSLELSTQTDADHMYHYTLELSFNNDGTCNISTPQNGMSVTGTGKFLKKSEKKAISGIDRDGLYLDYTVTDLSEGWSMAVKDTLVMRDRNVSAQYPAVEIKQ